jgi:hypothetical protein
LTGPKFDAAEIADLLKHTPRLKKLSYEDGQRFNSPIWQISEFVAAVECEVGNHLEMLRIFARGRTTGHEISLRAFRRLKSLPMPVDIRHHNVRAASKRAGGSMEDEPPWRWPIIADVVPASVSRLVLASRRSEPHPKSLELMFHHFADKKDALPPALPEIEIERHMFAFDAVYATLFKKN